MEPGPAQGSPCCLLRPGSLSGSLGHRGGPDSLSEILIQDHRIQVNAPVESTFKRLLLLFHFSVMLNMHRNVGAEDQPEFTVVPLRQPVVFV